jgi:ketosteroid isomerase-like protein
MAVFDRFQRSLPCELFASELFLVTMTLPNDPPPHGGDAAPEPSSPEPVATRQQMIEAVLQLLRLRAAADWTGLLDMVTDDCEVHMPGIPGVTPFAGRTTGRQNAIDAVRAMSTMLEPIKVIPLSFVQEDDTLVLTWTSSVRNRGTGPCVEVTGIARMRFRGRLISSYSNYFDTAAVAALISQTRESS